MILSIAGINSGADLSTQLLRGEGDDFEVNSAIGKRIDTSHFRIMDAIPPAMLVPDRAEVWVYDAAPNSSVVDPTWAISAYNTFKTGGSPVTDANPANWTPRLFAGYVATPKYSKEGRQRYITVDAQDYTVRLRTTVVNTAFAGGVSDQSMIQQLCVRYRPDFNTANVGLIVSNFPPISYPVHTLEQFLERIIKVSRGYYRVDYFKRVYYGQVGLQTAPFTVSDVPDYSSSFPAEALDYTPDGAGLLNRIWVVGGTFLSAQQAYTVPVSLVNGTNYQFPLPGNPELTGMSVTVNSTGQGTIGVAPGDGDTANPTSFKYNVLIQHTPATISFKTPPPNGATIVVTGKFRYPLVQVVTNQALITATGGLIFEGVLRDKRINDTTLAIQVGQAYLLSQGTTLKGGTATLRQRGVGNSLLQPGQQLNITDAVVFAAGVVKDAGGNPVTTAVVVVTQIKVTLTDDTVQPYEVQINFADRHVSGGY